MPRLAIIGLGKMGRTIEQLAAERGFEVVSRIDPHGGDAPTVDRASLRGADVAVEFSTPGAAVANVLAALDAGCPTVVGTTGWYERRPEVERRATERKSAVLIAPNFSVGVAAFMAIAQAAARVLRTAEGFDAHIVETHHSAKKDAPSGTAANLQKVAAAALGRDIPTTSVRTGSVPGTHELLFDAPFEHIRIEHVARDRRVFADGALLAAKWIIGRQGVFTMNDVLAGGDA
jgi:4-hydroxy-tetrahydrodipicolinate reductase